MFSPSDAGELNTLFAPARFIDENVFLTKSGEAGVVLWLGGIDYESLTDEALEDLHRRLLSVETHFDSRFRTYQYLVKQEGCALAGAASYPNPVVDQTVRRRNQFLAGKPLVSITLYRVLLYSPPLPAWRKLQGKLQRHGGLRVALKECRHYAEILRSRVKRLTHTGDNLLGIKMLDKRQAFTFFRFLGSFDTGVAAAEPLIYDDNVDYWMASVPQDSAGPNIPAGRRELEVMTLRKAPEDTWPNMLRDLLGVAGNYLICTTFQPEVNEQVSKVIHTAQDHFTIVKWAKSPLALLQLIMNRGKTDGIVPDTAAQKKIDELASALENMTLTGDSLGRFSFTAIAFEDRDNLPRLKTTALELQKIINERKGSLITEEYWAYGAYQSIIPGTTPGFDFRQRDIWLPRSQYLDLSLIYNHNPGAVLNPHLRKEYLLALETSDRTPYYFNLHEADLLGVLIFGIMGSGKSVFANLCADHAMKHDPWMLILDGLGGSFEMLTQKHRGNYYRLDPDGDWAFTLNPFAEPDSRKTRQYLAMLLRVCMVAGGFRPTAEKNQEIYKAVCRVMELPPDERRISRLELPERIAVYLAPWLGDGQYAYVFDNPRNTFALTKLQTIDFSLLEDFPDIVQPVLFHFFYLWSKIVNDPALLTTPKTMFVDEGWKMISYSAARRYIQAAGRTWRKRNGGIVLLTQSLDELERANLLGIVNELCPTKVLLYNPGGDYEKYADKFKLNAAELDMYRKLGGKGDLLLKTPHWSKTLHANLDNEALWTYANDPWHNSQRNEAIAKYGFEEGLKQLAAHG